MGRREKAGDASRLRAIRRQNSSSTLAEFARTIGYSPSYISAVELLHLPETPDLLQAYETGLGLTPSTLTAEKSTVPGILGRAGRVGSLSMHRPAFESHGSGSLGPWMSLLTEAAESTPRGSGRIYLTGQTSEDLFDDSDDAFFQLLRVMRRCLQSGWAITQVYSMNDDRQRSLQMVEAMIDLLGSHGDYQVVYLPEARATTPASDVLVVPGIAASLLLSSARGGSSSIELRTTADVEVMEEYCRLQAEAAQPLIAPLSREDPLKWEQLVYSLDEIPGPHFLVKNSLSSLLVSDRMNLAAPEWVARLGLQGEEAAGVERLRRVRLENFKRRALTDMHHNICPKQAIVQFLETGLWPDDEPNLAPLGLRERRGLIDNVTRNLRDYPKYELALIDESEVKWLRPRESDPLLTWMVRGNKVAFLETWPLDDDGRPTNVHIAMHEPSLTGAFADYFTSVWSRIAPANRDKARVIDWLESQAALLPGD